ncbi:carboxymuconolactone decarboxylase family protein [Brevibacterium samyangense]|uniref:Carboxymuconolactone decarboxylase family protein n=1 Tax=Brevibacterium samyangense TaxID=366888 RepID=A0ABP5ER04_9MICO
MTASPSLGALPFLDKAEPDVWKALAATAEAAASAGEAAGLERSTIELMNSRISQINGCAYCLDLHTRRALRAGVTEQQLHQLATWHDSPVFDEIDRVALELGEVVTRLPENPTRRDALDSARAHLGDEAFVALEWAAVLMNAYNRISILSEHPVRLRPEPRRSAR